MMKFVSSNITDEKEVVYYITLPRCSMSFIMKDIHNIASRAKEAGVISEGESPDRSLINWVKQKYPSLKLRVVPED